MLKLKSKNFLVKKAFIFIVSFVTYSLLWAEEKNLQLTSIETYCDDALEWYDDHPSYNGEFTRVLEYCKTYSKNVSPSGFSTNPILSDFGAMNGVNTRPRDQMHQGIDIIGPQNQPIIAIADGKVLETTIEDCWGATVVIDHGKSINGENLITIYGHVGEFLVSEDDEVKRGEIIAKLPEKIKYRCMARVRHLHLQIGQKYCKKEEKSNWGCKYFIKDYFSSLNPHKYWADGSNVVTCFEDNKEYKKGTITYPLPCKKIKN
tara:strand:- start:2823 stop:3605 length:783 start_codon:yes stop_codon:yes gene_type:complete